MKKVILALSVSLMLASFLAVAGNASAMVYVAKTYTYPTPYTHTMQKQITGPYGNTLYVQRTTVAVPYSGTVQITKTFY